MDDAMRKSVEDRAYALWEEAGRPEGSALLFWLRAERELGVISEVESEDPFVTLDELGQATQQRSPAEPARTREALQDAVEGAVPEPERLPDAAAENPLSEHVEQVAEGRASRGRARGYLRVAASPLPSSRDAAAGPATGRSALQPVAGPEHPGDHGEAEREERQRHREADADARRRRCRRSSSGSR